MDLQRLVAFAKRQLFRVQAHALVDEVRKELPLCHRLLQYLAGPPHAGCDNLAQTGAGMEARALESLLLRLLLLRLLLCSDAAFLPVLQQQRLPQFLPPPEQPARPL